MSFESPDNEKNFPGLYKAGSLSDQTSVPEEDHDRASRKKDLGKKKDGKKDKKEKGYMMFEEEDSEEDMVSLDDVKSPTKVKKSKPGFKFPARKDIFPKKEKEEKKEKETKKEEKKKEVKEEKKHKKEKKKPKHALHEVPAVAVQSEYDKPIFGVPLALSVERNKSHDGIELPAIFRECVDYIEEHGLSCEGIYRISGVKSKVQHLKDCYNKGVPAYLQEHEPNVVASLLKQFLRDLPEPVLTTASMPKFEEASTIKNEKRRIEQFKKLIEELPICNRLLLSWMIVHMTHIIELQKQNKMTLQNVSIVLSPTMQISHRVLNILFTYAGQLFADTIVKRYVPPLKPATSRWSLELPDNPAALEEELAKQESLLNELHRELNAGVTDSDKEEQLWEVQRVVTQLKRKIKFAKKAVEAAEKRRKDIESKKLSTHLPEEEELDLRPKKAEPKTSTKTMETEEKEQPDEPKSKEGEKSKNEAQVQKEAESENEDESQKEAQAQKEAEKEEKKIKRHSGVKAGTKITVEADVVKSAEEETEETAEETVEETKEGTEEELKSEDRGAEEEKDEVEKVETKAKKVKETEKVSLHPHIHLSSEPLKPIKAEQPVTPKKEETADDSLKKSVELRELEEELLGDGKTEKKVKFTEQAEERVMEEEEEESDLSETEVEVVDQEWEPIDDEEMQRLLEEEEAMKMEEEELLAIGDELRQKIETEQSEIERLHQEIQELQYLRQDSDLEDLSSSSESSYDSEDEDDLQDSLCQLIHDNEDLEKKNAELCQKIHEERMICLSVKLQIRLLQQKQLETSQTSVGGTDRETFL
ncbi:ralA-binding protein 1-like isoform X1 [Haliotis rufescens]|uniref:ralA-binding protein 1-like isoform X1 n=1 Tax=Haliotis rufescens TaxID=6454 RepID=UPI00201F936F|nr:ralA-binding protein 1-like isoform X1 [Haliotis rufescens]XP_048251127.1 ralA-binding protein 1-like isoform X1 [Haliotis rufescens]